MIALAILFTCISSAQNNNIIELWPNEVPLEKGVKKPARQTENHSGNVIRLTDVTNPNLTIYEPKNPNTSKAGVIVCPGGGYGILAFNKEGTEIATWLNSLGYNAFVLQYRVPKNRLGALQDVQRAIRWVRSKANVYNVDRDKIGLLGFSAGGHLVTNASINHQKTSYSKIDELDDDTCESNFSLLIYPAYLDKGENRSLSPELVLDKNKKTPPFFIFGTIDDPYGNSSLVMTTALRDAKKQVELHMMPKGGHGYGLRKGNLAAETWPKLAEKWLNNVLTIDKNKQAKK